MKSSEIAYLYETRSTPKPGALFLSRLLVLHDGQGLPLSFITLAEACTYAREQGWELRPLPADETYDPDAVQLGGDAWAAVHGLMSA